MNKAALVQKLSDEFNIAKAEAERIVEAIVREIVAALKRGEEVAIPDLGKFRVKDRAARTARNPRTGEIVKVPATRAPKFSASKSLKDAVR